MVLLVILDRFMRVYWFNVVNNSYINDVGLILTDYLVKIIEFTVNHLYY